MDSKSASSEPVEPIDAIVVDDPVPPRKSRREMWQSRLAQSELAAEQREQRQAVVRSAHHNPPPQVQAQPASSFVEAAQYVVPRRFGMSAILGIITALAVLFGMFRVSNVPPVLYLFFGVQAIVICIAQMLNGKTPRAASAIAGGVLLPLFLVAGAVFFEGRWRRDVVGAVCMVMASVPVGAVLGYMMGTLAAGVFLVMDAAEKMLPYLDVTPVPDRRR